MRIFFPRFFYLRPCIIPGSVVHQNKFITYSGFVQYFSENTAGFCYHQFFIISREHY